MMHGCWQYIFPIMQVIGVVLLFRVIEQKEADERTVARHRRKK